jgi:heme-degrading monooxygenase HmoA
MPYAFTYDVPITTEIYARVKEGLGPERPTGLIAHLTLQIENGLRYIDVWQSKDDFEAFAESRLHPVVHPILEGMLGFVPTEPSHTMLDVVDVWTDRHPA